MGSRVLRLFCLDDLPHLLIHLLPALLQQACQRCAYQVGNLRQVDPLLLPQVELQLIRRVKTGAGPERSGAGSQPREDKEEGGGVY